MGERKPPPSGSSADPSSPPPLAAATLGSLTPGSLTPDSLAPGSPSQGVVFVCDASAEAERLMTSLRNRGYPTVDVPIGMLPSRVRYEVPLLVVCDADAHEALRRVRETLEATRGQVKLVFVGHDDGALRHEPEFRRLAIATLIRPLDLSRTVDLIETIVGRPPESFRSRPPPQHKRRAPVLVAAARKPYRSDTDAPSERVRSSEPLAAWSDPPTLPPGARPSEGPISILPLVGDGSAPVALSSIPPSSDSSKLSPETRALLDEGRRKVAHHPHQSARPTRLPTEGTERGAPEAALLEALRKPLDADDSPEPAVGENEGPHSDLETDGARKLLPRDRPGESSLENQPASISRLSPLEPASTRFPEEEPPTHTASGLELGGSELPTPGSAPPLPTVVPPRRARSEGPLDDETNPGGRPATHRPDADQESDAGFDLAAPAHLPPPPLDDLSDLLESDAPKATTRTGGRRFDRLPGDGGREPTGPLPPQLVAITALAQAVRRRQTCSLAQEAGGGIRRVLLRDGDVLTVLSSQDDETLIHFLHGRGDLPDSVLAAAGQMHRFGRHAGAALIAQGLLRQENLWPVLRAHAEWLLGRVLLTLAPIVVEAEIPARSRDEPSVFGGAAGAEVFIEVLRRVIDPEAAYRALGGGELQIGLGESQSLLAECALAPSVEQRALKATERELRKTREVDPSILPVVLGLRELGVLSTGGRTSYPAARPSPNIETRSRELDDEASRRRIRSRRALVEEGDYFTILGVARSATRHEIDRARDDLRREFSLESLPAPLSDLRADIHAILETIDEAHFVLGDDVRRERYRRALEEPPARGIGR